ncbi:MAG: RNA polymerase sigma-70 factor [Mangrovibacterium sp.]|nr:RNA polymerase sigma-70 factor [Mangrovibacterium sp.]
MRKNDKQLLGLLLNGDEASFKVLYDYFYPKLFYFVSEYLPHQDLAEDIVHDTFLALWKNRLNLKPGTNLNAWLYTVAKNNSLKKIRDEKYRKAVFQSVQWSDDELELNAGALSKLDTSDLSFSEIQRIIQTTLDQLSPQCRLVFELSRFGSKMNKEIADELSISVKTVEGHMTKAVKAFRLALKDYLPLVAFLFLS